MGIGYYIFVIIMIIFAFGLLISMLMKIQENGKTDMLETMYKNGDITDTIYKKYKFKDNE